MGKEREIYSSEDQREERKMMEMCGRVKRHADKDLKGTN